METEIEIETQNRNCYILPHLRLDPNLALLKFCYEVH